MKAVALLSGGIDSPVAAHLMLKKGVEVVILHMGNAPPAGSRGGGAEGAPGEGGTGGTTDKDKAALLVEHLGRVHGRAVEGFRAPHGVTHQDAIARAGAHRLHCVLCKRAMLRTAEALCGRIGATAIITGESLGQVASQTLLNISVEDDAVDLPVLRPLIGMDKVEIVEMAREVGTYELSILQESPCRFVPDKPATDAGLEEVLEVEERMDVNGLVERCLDGLEKI